MKHFVHVEEIPTLILHQKVRLHLRVIAIRAFLAIVCLSSISYVHLTAQTVRAKFTFNLKKAANTSAGVYRKDSSLLRTLWNNVQYSAGTHTAYWDRKDDNGIMVSDSDFVINIVSGNVQYEWQGGIIGNTSDSMYGSSKHHYFGRPNSMSITGNTAFYSCGYNESSGSSFRFDLAKPQNKKRIISVLGDIDLWTDHTATDGKYVYWAGFDPYNNNVSLVYASSVMDDKEILFSEGVSVAMTSGRTYFSAIDINTNTILARPSGLAVQKKGIFLFVAHKELNELHVVNKNTGELIQTISISLPRQLAVDMNDNLWIISGNNLVQKYIVHSDGSLSSPLLSIPNLEDPIALAVSPNNYLVAVIDAGNSQQLKFFNNNTGIPVWTLGQEGGYAKDPNVYEDKFYFKDTFYQVNFGTFIAFQSDSSFWLGDPGNERIQHFSSGGTYINTIMCLPHSYSVEADRNNPSRVFNEFLEFKIDYSKSLAPRNGSWTLVKNWRAGVGPNYLDPSGAYKIFSNVLTLSNGLTYATLEDRTAGKREIVELPSNGNLRYTGITFESWEDFLIDKKGNLIRMYTGSVQDTMEWTSRKLDGFDNMKNPIWGSTETIASSQPTSISDPKPNLQSAPAITNSNRLIVFNPKKNDGYGLRSGYHLGAIKKGTNTWLWKTCKSTDENYIGPMPSDGTFDIGNSVIYPGGQAYAIENNIFWNYHGEFWKNSQTNIWMHYADNGLMIGRFGTTAFDAEIQFGPEAFPMGAGNVFSSVLVKVDSFYYLYHNDESVHGAIHRWKISGLNSIETQKISVILPQLQNGGLRVTYFDGKDLDNFKIKSSSISQALQIINAPSSIADKDNYSAEFKGYVKADSSASYQFIMKAEAGFRLWINDSLMLDHWDNNDANTFISQELELIEGEMYSIRLEAIGSTLQLLWKRNAQIQNIDKKFLFTEEAIDDRNWIDLLEKLPYKSELRNGEYGWFREPKKNIVLSNDNFNWVYTNLKTYGRDKHDINFSIQDTSGTVRVERKLSNIPKCNSSWEVRATINLEQNSPNRDGKGFYIEIKDSFNKTICKISHEQLNGFGFFPDYVVVKYNAEDVINLPYYKMYKYTSGPIDFYIKLENGKSYFQFADQLPILCDIYDKDAVWNMPASIQFNFEGTLENYRREFNISKLEIRTLKTPALTYSDSDRICSGTSVILKTEAATFYKWSNGDTGQSISVNTSGEYFVRTGNDKNCLQKSGIRKLLVIDGPKPIITRVLDTLISNYPRNNQWFLDGLALPGENKMRLIIPKSGNYSVMVIDSNSCSGISDALDVNRSAISTSEKFKEISIIPNPNNGIFQIVNLDENCRGIKILDMNGRTVFETSECQSLINANGLKSGVYLVQLQFDNAILSKLISVIP